MSLILFRKHLYIVAFQGSWSNLTGKKRNHPPKHLGIGEISRLVGFLVPLGLLIQVELFLPTWPARWLQRIQGAKPSVLVSIRKISWTTPRKVKGNTLIGVDGSEIRRSSGYVVYHSILQNLMDLRWCRIPSINSRLMMLMRIRTMVMIIAWWYACWNLDGCFDGVWQWLVVHKATRSIIDLSVLLSVWSEQYLQIDWWNPKNTYSMHTYININAYKHVHYLLNHLKETLSNINTRNNILNIPASWSSPCSMQTSRRVTTETPHSSRGLMMKCLIYDQTVGFPPQTSHFLGITRNSKGTCTLL